jgi:hypothetical protein
MHSVCCMNHLLQYAIGILNLAHTTYLRASYYFQKKDGHFPKRQQLVGDFNTEERY